MKCKTVSIINFLHHTYATTLFKVLRIIHLIKLRAWQFSRKMYESFATMSPDNKLSNSVCKTLKDYYLSYDITMK